MVPFRPEDRWRIGWRAFADGLCSWLFTPGGIPPIRSSRGHLPGVNRVGGGLRRRPLTPPDVLTYHGGFYQLLNLS
jgi:hypothetical protein